MTDTTETTPKRFQCRHIHTEGRRCGSASLRGEEFCYFHHTSRKPVASPRTRRTRQATFDLPLPEDRGAIQLSLGEVLRRIATNAIDPRRAGLLLYGLQIAALNLPPHKSASSPRERENSVVEEVIADPTHGALAPRHELPNPNAPREEILTAKLLAHLRVGSEQIEAEHRAKFEAELQQRTQPEAHLQPETNAQPEPELQPASELEVQSASGLRLSREADAAPQPKPVTLPTLNASEELASPVTQARPNHRHSERSPRNLPRHARRRTTAPNNGHSPAKPKQPRYRLTRSPALAPGS